mmetsp:Transcript_3366/g.6816  ORF Transcript_3366/g.6816 Transcript_3366/m.6816 type:complete len:213 (-) Transcript_3366:116-754(-)
MAMVGQHRVHSRLPAAALLLAGALGLLLLGGDDGAFTGAPLEPSHQRGDRLALQSIVTRKAGMKRRQSTQNKRTMLVEEKGRTVSKFYKELLGIEAEAEFSPAAAVNGKETTVEIKQWPSGILRYQPGKDWKGAMVKDVSKPYYIGDPSGSAFAAGVESGMVVKSINGTNVLMLPYDEILEALGNEQHALLKGDIPRVKLPLTVTFASIPQR